MSSQAHWKWARHPLQGEAHPTSVRRLALLLLVGLAGWAGVSGREAAQEKKQRPPEVVIVGTVFTEKGFLLAGATIRVNRVGERKAKWEAASDRRGEFGVRVPPGAEYEVRVNAKGYEEQRQKVDARSSTYESMVFRMTPLMGGKKP